MRDEQAAAEDLALSSVAVLQAELGEVQDGGGRRTHVPQWQRFGIGMRLKAEAAGKGQPDRARRARVYVAMSRNWRHGPARSGVDGSPSRPTDAAMLSNGRTPELGRTNADVVGHHPRETGAVAPIGKISRAVQADDPENVRRISRRISAMQPQSEYRWPSSPTWSVDFDFGDQGQIDGIDPHRLRAFAERNLGKYGLASGEEVDQLFAHAVKRGSLSFSGYILYYVS